MPGRYRQLLYGTGSMRNIGAEFLTVLPAYLEPRAFAADNAWPPGLPGHELQVVRRTVAPARMARGISATSSTTSSR